MTKGNSINCIDCKHYKHTNTKLNASAYIAGAYGICQIVQQEVLAHDGICKDFSPKEKAR